MYEGALNIEQHAEVCEKIYLMASLKVVNSHIAKIFFNDYIYMYLVVVQIDPMACDA